MATVDDKHPKSGAIDEKALIAKLQAEHTQTQIKTSKFPTEVIDLPSKGLLYPEGHPLANGTIEMKYMTAREEDILSSPNLIKQGIVIDKLLQSLIITPINYNDIITGDKNAIMIASRILGYGKEYKSTITCSECEEEQDYTIDLTKLDDKEFDESLITPHTNSFVYTLPKSGRKITFKLINHGEDKQIETELKAKIKTGNSTEITSRLSKIITSVDGNTDNQYIRNFVENELFAIDSKDLRSYIQKINPDIDTTINFNCIYCTHEEEMNLPITVDFFWPTL